jgi:tetratricopeptide (TPR) repeat protein
MAEQVPFINREDELTRIKDVVEKWKTRLALCIHAPGGIGKTRLLQEVYYRWRMRGTASLLVGEILTFDERALHTPENLQHRLAEMLGKDAFAPYFRHFIDYQKMTKAEVSEERLEQERYAVSETFRACFQEVLSERRGILFLDTVDALVEGGGTWNYIADDLVPQPCNALFLIAGRNARKLHQQIERNIGQDAHLLDLPPLDPDSSAQYLRARQEQLYFTIGSEMIEKISLLADGRPILIDLAVDWLAHERPLPWLDRESLEEIRAALDSGEWEVRRKEFEHNLIRQVFELREPMDRLMLTLNHVYPLNTPLIATLLNLSNDRAQILLEEARSYISIKPLPNGYITLHDEVRRMIDDLEKELDPQGSRKQNGNRKAAIYFEKAVQALRRQIQQAEEIEKAASASGEAKKEFEASLKRSELETEYWVVAGQWLHHTLRALPSLGVETFIQLFDETTRAYRFSNRRQFVQQILRIYDRIPAELRYEVDIRRAQHLFQDTEYTEARTVLQGLWKDQDLLPYQQAQVLIQLGNVEIRLGALRAGNEYFEKAVAISRQHEMKEWLLRAELALGWGKRLVGQLEDAIAHYRNAYELSIDLEDREQEGWSLNNFAYAYAQLGRWREALPLCKQAEALWNELDHERGLAALYEVYGEVYTRSGEYDKAMSSFQRALNIFEAHHDQEWICRIYTEIGITYRFAGDLDIAECALMKAAKLDVPQFRAQILHGLAHIYMARDEIDKAAEYFESSYKQSLESSDARHELNNLGDIASLAVLKEQYNRLGEFEALYREFKEKWPDVNYYRAEGSLLLQLGKLALGARPEDSDLAAGYLEQAFPLLADYGDLPAYQLHTQLRELEEYLENQELSAEQIIPLGKRLYETWKRNGLDTTHPEALGFLVRWMKGSGKNA